MKGKQVYKIIPHKYNYENKNFLCRKVLQRKFQQIFILSLDPTIYSAKSSFCKFQQIANHYNIKLTPTTYTSIGKCPFILG
jgi:hypothetical protein